MTVIPFPKPPVPSPKAVDDFKRVCDTERLELRDDDIQAVLERIAAELEPIPPKPLGPPLNDV